MRESKRETQTQSSGVKRVQFPRVYKLCGDVCGRKQASEAELHSEISREVSHDLQKPGHSQ